MEIKEKFDAPFGPIPALRLTTVPRWAIIRMDTKQSVAEHAFRVARIVKWLYEKNIVDSDTDYFPQPGFPNTMLLAIYEALQHDDAEVYTGDIPSPAKNAGGHEPTNVVKLADLIEAYTFANVHCNDTDDVRIWLLGKLKQKIYTQIADMDISYTKISPLMGN